MIFGSWFSAIIVAILAFLLEIVDASLGMGYGTILTPVLLMLGFDPSPSCSSSLDIAACWRFSSRLLPP